MKLTQIGSNQSEVTTNDGTRVLFSYSTPVAATMPDGNQYKTSTKYSSTTTRHINANGYRNAEEKPQAFFDSLTN